MISGDLKPDGREQPETMSGSKREDEIIMSTKLYVGNLSYNITENQLHDHFAQYGSVTEANLVVDRMTQRPRGFGFVTMSTKEEADAAIEALNGKEWEGRALTVNEARPREERAGGGGGFRGRGDGGGRSKDY